MFDAIIGVLASLGGVTLIVVAVVTFMILMGPRI